VSAVGSFPLPGKLYFKQGCLPVALRELTEVYCVSRVLLLTDEEMLHNGRLTPLTNTLHELGLAYAVNNETFAAEAVIGFGSARLLDRAAALAVDRLFIAVPVSAAWEFSIQAWRHADLLILDEDLCLQAPENEICAHIAQIARASLVGADPSDYTLGLSVQAMRSLFDKAHTPSSLLHAAAMAEMAYTAACADQFPEDGLNLFPEAAEALGMTVEALEAKLNCAVDPAH
jgi:hypothetical protein